MNTGKEIRSEKLLTLYKLKVAIKQFPASQRSFYNELVTQGYTTCRKDVLAAIETMEKEINDY